MVLKIILAVRSLNSWHQRYTQYNVTSNKHSILPAVLIILLLVLRYEIRYNKNIKEVSVAAWAVIDLGTV